MGKTNTEEIKIPEAAEVKNPETAETMSPETAAVAAAPGEEMVDLFVERDSSDENPNLLIGINGKNYLMPRGKTSRVPKYVADEYERSRKAQYMADENCADMKGINEAK